MGQFSIIRSFENFASLGAEWVMWLMIILGFIMIVIAIERLMLFLKSQVDVASLGRELAERLSEGQVAQATCPLRTRRARGTVIFRFSVNARSLICSSAVSRDAMSRLPCLSR